VQKELPFVSILVPVRPNKKEVKAAEAARHFDYPAEKLEIVVVHTTNPSIGPGVKRNAGLKAIKGELVYMLDDDSQPAPDMLRRAVQKFLDDPAVKMVGGPNVVPPDAPLLERVLGCVMGSWLAFGPSCARYRPVGRLRPTTEKELISCNLVANRAAVLAVGFDPKLWPNEENAMMDGVQKSGGKLLYDPEFVLQRRPRRDFKAYRRMLVFYGGGRAHQLRMHPTVNSIPNFMPGLFLLYLAALPFLFLVPALVKFAGLLLLPLALYLLAVLVQTAFIAARSGLLLAICSAPIIIATTLFYGFGFLWGLIKPIPAPPPAPEHDIRFERVPVTPP
jgi:succinoglycan biosynthesis protein ExoA